MIGFDLEWGHNVRIRLGGSEPEIGERRGCPRVVEFVLVFVVLLDDVEKPRRLPIGVLQLFVVIVAKHIGILADL